MNIHEEIIRTINFTLHPPFKFQTPRNISEAHNVNAKITCRRAPDARATTHLLFISRLGVLYIHTSHIIHRVTRHARLFYLFSHALSFSDARSHDCVAVSPPDVSVRDLLNGITHRRAGAASIFQSGACASPSLYSAYTSTVLQLVYICIYIYVLEDTIGAPIESDFLSEAFYSFRFSLGRWIKSWRRVGCVIGVALLYISDVFLRFFFCIHDRIARARLD